MALQLLFFAPGAYLLGSVPFGKLIAKKAAGVDITSHGSGNIGATNVAREVSLRWGLLTLALDMLKGIVPVVLFSYAVSEPGFCRETCVMVTGLAALAGHQFSVFLHFHGGKGVGTAMGVFLAIAPVSCLMSLLVFLLAVSLWKYVSLGSMLAAGALPLFIGLTGGSPVTVAGAVIAAALIALRHRDNIRRLTHGREPQWGHKGIGKK